MDWEELLRGHFDSIASVNTDTLPQGDEAAFFHSKPGLVKEHHRLTAQISRVESELRQCSMDELSDLKDLLPFGRRIQRFFPESLPRQQGENTSQLTNELPSLVP